MQSGKQEKKSRGNKARGEERKNQPQSVADLCELAWSSV